MGGGDESGEEFFVCVSMFGLEWRCGVLMGILGGDDVNDGLGFIIMWLGVILGWFLGILSLGFGNGVRFLDSGGLIGFLVLNEVFVDFIVGGFGVCFEFFMFFNVIFFCGFDVFCGVVGCVNGLLLVGFDDFGLMEIVLWFFFDFIVFWVVLWGYWFGNLVLLIGWERLCEVFCCFVGCFFDEEFDVLLVFEGWFCCFLVVLNCVWIKEYRLFFEWKF